MNATNLKAMSLPVALLCFGVPAAVIAVDIHFIMPIFDRQGLGIFWNYMFVYAAAPMLLLIAASFVAFRLEGNPMTWAAVRVRFRLGNMNKQGWFWAFGLLVFMFITVGMLGFTARGLADLPILAPPSH